MEKITSCPVCSNKIFANYIDTKDFFLTNELFSLQQCTNCKLVFTNPYPDEKSIQKYYKSSDYISHSETKKGIINSLYHLIRKYTITNKYSTVKNNSSGNRIIDYGSGSGALLAYFNKKDYTSTGYEIDEEARKLSVELYGINAKNPSEIITNQSKSIDVIMLWHVLEHVYYPDKLLNIFHKILTDNGRLFIALPNLNSFDAKYYGKYWAALDVPRHLFHYTPFTLKMLLEKNDFELIKTKGMIFDSFYISILSEKYKNKFLSFFFGMFMGLISNLSAFFKNKAYSSCLYIVKKKETDF